MKKDNKQRLFEVMSKIDGTFKPELNEIQSNEIYFDTLSQALEAATAKAEKKGYAVDNDDIWNTFGTGGVGYGETKRGSIGLTLNGKPQRNALQIVIYRMESGKYELTSYIR